TTLLSSVSHDLQTPLVSLMATLSHLARRRSPEWWASRGPEALAGLEAEARRLYLLTTNLLDLAHLQAGRWQPPRQRHDLGDLVGSTLARLGQAEAARVRTELPDALPPANVDGPRVV